jgi:hypothetical protein
VATFWKRIDNANAGSFSAVSTGATPLDALGGARDVKPSRIDDGQMITVEQGKRRIAYCECGAQLAGDSERELFDAVQRHVAHLHPQLLGALEFEVVRQMAEDVGRY